MGATVTRFIPDIYPQKKQAFGVNNETDPTRDPLDKTCDLLYPVGCGTLPRLDF